MSRRWSDLGLFMSCPSLSEHMAVSWYVFVMCSIVTPPLLLPYYLVRINTCFRSLVTLYILLLFSILCQIESLLCWVNLALVLVEWYPVVKPSLALGYLHLFLYFWYQDFSFAFSSVLSSPCFLSSCLLV